VANPDPVAVRRAIIQYERAVALDPGFALAWASLGRAEAVMYVNGVPTAEDAASPKTAAERALATHASKSSQVTQKPAPLNRELKDPPTGEWLLVSRDRRFVVARGCEAELVPASQSRASGR
jgi:hypothetical protein